MSHPLPDKKILIGVMALHKQFIEKEQFVDAVNRWSANKSRPLAEILVEAGYLTKSQCKQLQPLVDEVDSTSPRKAEKSVHTLFSTLSLGPDIEQIADTDIREELGLATRADASDSGELPTRQVAVPPAEELRETTVYKIVRPHARGGLGEVFVALDLGLHREVALKEIQTRHSKDTASRDRFVFEAEVTGKLEHPGIVPVYGFGMYEDGRPFYTMRFIRGESLRDAIATYHSYPWSKKENSKRILAFHSLLRRFVDVCHAIDYAHSRGIIHRDLKPGNIMLGKYGETLVVDWGLAKSIDKDAITSEVSLAPITPSISNNSSETLPGSAVGTPQYMSPEQAEGQLHLVGPASDVYSLGATLYTLLTGQTPIESNDVFSVLMKVRRGEFRPPSKLQPGIPSALEAICLKAMALLPSDRYRTAADIAADIERWFADEPVFALPESPTRRGMRWVRKHQRLVTTSAAGLLVAIVGLALGLVALSARKQELKEINQTLEIEKSSALQARHLADKATVLAESKRIEAERQAQLAKTALQRAETEAQNAREVAAFVVSTLGAADPVGLDSLMPNLRLRRGEALTLRELLDRGAKAIRSMVGSSPQVRASILDAIGNSYRAMGAYKDAEPLLKTSLELRKASLPANHPDLAESKCHLASLYFDIGRYDDAESLFREGIAAMNDPLKATIPKLRLAWLLAETKPSEECERLFHEIIETRTQKLGPTHTETAVAQLGLSAVLLENQKFSSALPITLKAIASLSSSSEYRDFAKAVSLFQLGVCDRFLFNRYDSADKNLKECLRLAKVGFGDSHIYVAAIYYQLGENSHAAGKHEDAKAHFAQSLKIARETVGLSHPKSMILIQNYADVLADTRQIDQAIALVEEHLRAINDRYGAQHRIFADALYYAADFYSANNHPAQAEKKYRQAIAIYRQVKGVQKFETASLCHLGALLLQSEKNYPEAESLLREALTELRQTKGKERATASVCASLGMALMKQEKQDEVASLVKQGRDLLASISASEASEAWELYQTHSTLLFHQASWKEHEELLADWDKRLGKRAFDKWRLARAIMDQQKSATATTRKAAMDVGAAGDYATRMALKYIELAINAGFADLKTFDTDKRFERLRTNPKFTALRPLVQKNAEKKSKPSTSSHQPNSTPTK